MTRRHAGRALAHRKGTALLAPGVVALGILFASLPASAQRIRQFVTVKNARENFLEGKALVVGLNGTGDSPKGATLLFIVNYFNNRGGFILQPQDINSKNIAIVSVTAVLPSFAKEGTRLDAHVAALGDAKSLKGGRLLLAPLNGPRGDNPRVYAVAEGDLVQGGPNSHPTTAVVPRGALVEKAAELTHQWIEAGERITLYLDRPDFHLAHVIADGLRNEPESSFGFRSPVDADEYGFVHASDAATLVLRVPPRYEKDPVSFLAKVLETDLGEAAKTWQEGIVYVNEHTGDYAVSGDAWVLPGRVGTRSFMTLAVQDTMRMQDFIAVATAQPGGRPAAPGAAPGAASPIGSRDVVDLILALDRADMLRAKLVTIK